MSARIDFEGRVGELRAAFDRSFSIAELPPARDVEDMLAIRLAGHPYALRLHEITAVVDRREVVAVPTRAPHVLGLLGLRGEILPVFSLRSLLGYDDDGEAPAWSVVCGREEPIALGFDVLEGHRRLGRAALRTNDDARSRKYVEELALTDGGVRSVIALSRVVATLRNKEP